MALTGYFYGAFIDHLAQKRIDLDSDALKVALVTSSYTPNKDTHDFFNDITGEVSAGGGYTSGGAALASVTWTYNSSTDTWTFDAADTTWTSLTLAAAQYVVLYDSTPGTAATNPLIALFDNGSNFSCGGGNLVVQWNAAGIGTLTV